MTGAEHAREAERLLANLAARTESGSVYYGESGQELVVCIPQLLAALVHASLAVAAALAVHQPDRNTETMP